MQKIIQKRIACVTKIEATKESNYKLLYSTTYWKGALQKKRERKKKLVKWILTQLNNNLTKYAKYKSSKKVFPLFVDILSEVLFLMLSLLTDNI